jgi:hypothetical protein
MGRAIRLIGRPGYTPEAAARLIPVVVGLVVLCAVACGNDDPVGK